MIALAKIRSASASIAIAAAALGGMFVVFAAFPTRWPFPAPLVRIAAEFLAGVLLCRAYRCGLGQGWRWSVIAPATLAGCLAVSSGLEASGHLAIWVAPLLALLILAVARDNGWLAHWLGSRHMVFLGQVSYALYMTHAVSQLALDRVLPPAALASRGAVVRLGAVAAYAVVVLLVAVCVYTLVEVPCRRWMRGRLAD